MVFDASPGKAKPFANVGKNMDPSSLRISCFMAFLLLLFGTLFLHWESKEGTAPQDGDLRGGRNQLSLEGKRA